MTDSALSEVALLKKQLKEEQKAHLKAKNELESTAEALYHAQLEVELAAKSRADFIANMSHELRTPLNSIVGFSDLLLSGSASPMTEEQTDFITEILTAGKQLTNIVEQILAIAKLKDGMEDFVTEEVLLQDALCDLLSTSKTRAEALQIEFNVEIQPDLPPVESNIPALLKIVCNLIDNAIKFCPSGKEVMFLAYENADGAVQMDVMDQGIGMSETELRKATTPFYQADSSRSRQFEGTGLGLSIVQNLVDAHNAELSLFSIPDNVTRASVIFPKPDATEAPEISSARTVPTHYAAS